MARRLALVFVALIAMAAAGCGGPAGPPPVTVAAQQDAESALLAHLYAAALRYYGNATQVTTTGSPLQALDAGEVEVVPEFTGRLLYRLQPDATARADAQVYRQMVSALPEGVAAGDYAMSAEDKPAVAITEATAQTWGGSDVSALLDNCHTLAIGAVRGAHVPTLVGGCRLPKAREFPDDTRLFAALRAGQVNAAWTSTAAPDIPSDLVVLADRTALIRAENVVPLYRRNELNEAQVLAINEVAGVLDTAALADMRRQVAEGADPAAVADAFLAENPLRH
jgi:glycine betaine/choline ABC-type transport system substrate-binding protein